MSRRKRVSSARNTSSTGAGRRPEPSAGSPPAGPQPPPISPPRPNRWFLLISALLLAGWITFLAVLALTA